MASFPSLDHILLTLSPLPPFRWSAPGLHAEPHAADQSVRGGCRHQRRHRCCYWTAGRPPAHPSWSELHSQLLSCYNGSQHPHYHPNRSPSTVPRQPAASSQGGVHPTFFHHQHCPPGLRDPWNHHQREGGHAGPAAGAGGAPTVWTLSDSCRKLTAFSSQAFNPVAFNQMITGLVGQMLLPGQMGNDLTRNQKN